MQRITTTALSDLYVHLLTPREREVLRLMALGYRVKEIETMLALKHETARKHWDTVLAKLQIRRSHVVVVALAAGLVTLAECVEHLPDMAVDGDG